MLADAKYDASGENVTAAGAEPSCVSGVGMRGLRAVTCQYQISPAVLPTAATFLPLWKASAQAAVPKDALSERKVDTAFPEEALNARATPSRQASATIFPSDAKSPHSGSAPAGDA